MKDIVWIALLAAALLGAFAFGKQVGEDTANEPRYPQTRYECLQLGSDFARTACIKHYEL